MLRPINKRFYILVSVLSLGLCISGCGSSGKKAMLVTEGLDEGISTEVQDFDSDSDTDNGGSYQSIPVELEQLELDVDSVTVYVCGAVVTPGVYQLSNTAIKQDALNEAGGFASGASTTYVNLAEIVCDGEKIYFPYEDELEPDYTPLDDNIQVYEESSGKVNINTATKEELMTLSGIGESKAEDIISYREEHGGFSSIEEIMNINGIKEGVYNKIKDDIVVD